ncbi:MAG: hypothetical protein UT08_C0009G0031 [Candidatus Woesebacteria bacterium GW2011_GWB1_38_8]|uniref:Uncharacterized protein n=2 Tax=Candidatus Woeseibacteriota TaxID=1752722 RepID=A0A0G0L2H2_9BACT|nr:MAG: hypothetical protein UT08_C0009G0031 [Candidatus Woesebacteria bacterium GW2011_GWB1_38_8]KKS77774.1 MAG: hypothetical protein UV51_C0005G0184 [Candidatus Woesebacteria bacterium GW2011_GWC1_42_9]OGM22006.1 MAG: hypothetical protein A2863_03975 [Candidatus Woesebacteria bacterium RIFCSPHIGHO2_01_FULL_38_9b]
MPVDYVESLLRVFKVIAFICFIATGAMATGAVYKVLKDHFPDKFEKKHWPFIPIAILIYLVLLYIYNLMF